MKNRFLLFISILVLTTLNLYPQNLDYFSFTLQIRVDGKVLANDKNKNIIVTIYKSDKVTAIFSETISNVSTNNIGLCKLKIGSGIPILTGDLVEFSSIDWSYADYTVGFNWDGKIVRSGSKSKFKISAYSLSANLATHVDTLRSKLADTIIVIEDMDMSQKNILNLNILSFQNNENIDNEIDGQIKISADSVLISGKLKVSKIQSSKIILDTLDSHTNDTIVINKVIKIANKNIVNLDSIIFSNEELIDNSTDGQIKISADSVLISGKLKVSKIQASKIILDTLDSHANDTIVINKVIKIANKNIVNLDSIIFSNDELIDNSTDGQIKITADSILFSGKLKISTIQAIKIILDTLDSHTNDTIVINKVIKMGNNNIVHLDSVIFFNNEFIDNSIDHTIRISADTTKLTGILKFNNNQTIDNLIKDEINITAISTIVSGKLKVKDTLTFNNNEIIDNTIDGQIRISADSTLVLGLLLVKDTLFFENKEYIENKTDGLIKITSDSVRFTGELYLAKVATDPQEVVNFKLLNRTIGKDPITINITPDSPMFVNKGSISPIAIFSKVQPIPTKITWKWSSNKNMESPTVISNVSNEFWYPSFPTSEEGNRYVSVFYEFEGGVRTMSSATKLVTIVNGSPFIKFNEKNTVIINRNGTVFQKIFSSNPSTGIDYNWSLYDSKNVFVDGSASSFRTNTVTTNVIPNTGVYKLIISTKIAGIPYENSLDIIVIDPASPTLTSSNNINLVLTPSLSAEISEVTCSGSGIFEWYITLDLDKQGVKLKSTTNKIVSLTNLYKGVNYLYCKVNGLNSAPVIINVVEVKIVGGDTIVKRGYPTILSIKSGVAPDNVVWYKGVANNPTIQVANSDTYIPSTSLLNTNYYRALCTFENTSLSTPSVIVTVLDPKLDDNSRVFIDTLVLNTLNPIGLKTSSSPIQAYQWYYKKSKTGIFRNSGNKILISGATSSTFTPTNLEIDQVDYNYFFFCEIDYTGLRKFFSDYREYTSYASTINFGNPLTQTLLPDIEGSLVFIGDGLPDDVPVEWYLETFNALDESLGTATLIDKSNQIRPILPAVDHGKLTAKIFYGGVSIIVENPLDILNGGILEKFEGAWKYRSATIENYPSTVDTYFNEKNGYKKWEESEEGTEGFLWFILDGVAQKVFCNMKRADTYWATVSSRMSLTIQQHEDLIPGANPDGYYLIDNNKDNVRGTYYCDMNSPIGGEGTNLKSIVSRIAYVNPLACINDNSSLEDGYYMVDPTPVVTSSTYRKRYISFSSTHPDMTKNPYEINRISFKHPKEGFEFGARVTGVAYFDADSDGSNFEPILRQCNYGDANFDIFRVDGKNSICFVALQETKDFGTSTSTGVAMFDFDGITGNAPIQLNRSTTGWLSSTGNFTSCGANGRYGPTQAQLNATYTGKVLFSGNFAVTTEAGVKTVPYVGYQKWIVPVDAKYKILVNGASGGDTYTNGTCSGSESKVNGAIGYKLGIEINLNKNDNLYILVGQQSRESVGGNTCVRLSAGGGASYVTLGNSIETSVALAIAGGGGGHWSKSSYLSNGKGRGVTSTTFGGNASSDSGGGGGFVGDGNSSASRGKGGKSFRNGGVGGLSTTTSWGGDGGFGGGGGTVHGYLAAGGGGSRGGNSSFDDSRAGDGGYSYAISSSTTFTASSSAPYGNGSVSISFKPKP